MPSRLDGAGTATESKSEEWQVDGPSELDLLRLAMSSGAFDDLADPREDVYSPDDGKPLAAD
jgi:hypothetical protein